MLLHVLEKPVPENVLVHGLATGDQRRGRQIQRQSKYTNMMILANTLSLVVAMEAQCKWYTLLSLYEGEGVSEGGSTGGGEYGRGEFGREGVREGAREGGSTGGSTTS